MAASSIQDVKEVSGPLERFVENVSVPRKMDVEWYRYTGLQPAGKECLIATEAGILASGDVEVTSPSTIASPWNRSGPRSGQQRYTTVNHRTSSATSEREERTRTGSKLAFRSRISPRCRRQGWELESAEGLTAGPSVISLVSHYIHRDVRTWEKEPFAVTDIDARPSRMQAALGGITAPIRPLYIPQEKSALLDATAQLALSNPPVIVADRPIPEATNNALQPKAYEGSGVQQSDANYGYRPKKTFQHSSKTKQKWPRRVQTELRQLHLPLRSAHILLQRALECAFSTADDHVGSTVSASERPGGEWVDGSFVKDSRYVRGLEMYAGEGLGEAVRMGITAFSIYLFASPNRCDLPEKTNIFALSEQTEAMTLCDKPNVDFLWAIVASVGLETTYVLSRAAYGTTLGICNKLQEGHSLQAIQAAKQTGGSQQGRALSMIDHDSYADCIEHECKRSATGMGDLEHPDLREYLGHLDLQDLERLDLLVWAKLGQDWNGIAYTSFLYDFSPADCYICAYIASGLLVPDGQTVLIGQLFSEIQDGWFIGVESREVMHMSSRGIQRLYSPASHICSEDRTSDGIRGFAWTTYPGSEQMCIRGMSTSVQTSTTCTQNAVHQGVKCLRGQHARDCQLGYGRRRYRCRRCAGGVDKDGPGTVEESAPDTFKDDKPGLVEDERPHRGGGQTTCGEKLGIGADDAIGTRMQEDAQRVMFMQLRVSHAKFGDPQKIQGSGVIIPVLLILVASLTGFPCGI
ncbi:hypothetical protein OE88DRAFT_1729410 [Heliocybe sulcata]|uniref:Uncharacterized protein n=1 Tax=Heliocybe sulcata TaxID=5364 RepID=A0A5C3MMJ0_9AGAM|nr:hypothetical protein OE88DRAFT_1729410 [Heliocybe sulcata]